MESNFLMLALKCLKLITGLLSKNLCRFCFILNKKKTSECFFLSLLKYIVYVVYEKERKAYDLELFC